MSKKVFYGLILGAVFSLTTACLRHPMPQRIALSGKVTYDEFKKGDIEIYLTSWLEHGAPNAAHMVGEVLRLAQPGPFRFLVPKNYGVVYICARNRAAPLKSLAYYISDPILVGDKDIPGCDVILKTNRRLMEGYTGATVTLSGRVLCKEYKKGVLDICVYSPDWYKKVRLPPDIAQTTLRAPGDFSVTVPAGIGDVCLAAVNIPEGERSGNSPRCLRGSYAHNPVRVGNADIGGIEITVTQ